MLVLSWGLAGIGLNWFVLGIVVPCVFVVFRSRGHCLRVRLPDCLESWVPWRFRCWLDQESSGEGFCSSASWGLAGLWSEKWIGLV